MTTVGYTAEDAARWRPERPKTALLDDGGTIHRSPFARDRARVLHSAALRRLAAKTQVVGPDEGDVPRTRLTHSLEVAQIGRGIAEELGADPDITDTAGLAHDIGHPPFGHNGERALNTIAEECGGFEGNAQTLRILTRLEPKQPGAGLNLTRACLDAAVKYPWRRDGGRTKFGVYEDDLAVFEWLRAEAPGEARCVEAQIMDWSDDVAYSVHDVEDGVISGRISLRTLTDAGERAEIARLAADSFGGHSSADLEVAAEGLLSVPAVAAAVAIDYDGSLAASIALKRLTSELVGRFASAAVVATRAKYGFAPLTRYAADLEVPPLIAAEVSVLKAVALRYVMSDQARLDVQLRQRVLLTELVTALRRIAPTGVDPWLRPAWYEADTDAARLRVLIDQISLLTDFQAVRWHRRVVGQR